MNFARGFSLTATSMLLVYGLGFLNQSFLSRVLPADDFGDLAYWSTTIMFGSMLLGDWLARGSTYVIGHERAIPGAVTNAVAYCGLLLACVGGLALARGAERLPTGLPPTWLLVAGLIAVSATQRVGLGILLGHDLIRRYALVPLLAIILYLAGNAVATLSGEMDLDRVLSVWLFALATSAALALLPGLRHSFRMHALDAGLLRHTAVIGGRGALSYLLIFLLFRSNIWLIDHYLGSASVASFRVATLFTDMLQRLPNVAGVVLLAKVVRGEDTDQALSLPVAQGVLLFSLASALALLVTAPALIHLFYPRYREAYGILVWMLPGLVFSGFGSVLNTRLAGHGYPPVTVWAPAVALLVGVGLNVWLIPALALRGAALATSVSLALWGVLVARAYFHLTGVGWRDLLRSGELTASIGRRAAGRGTRQGDT